MSLPESAHSNEHWFDRLAAGLARACDIRFDRRALGGAGVVSLMTASVIRTASHSSATAQTQESQLALGHAATTEGLLVAMLGIARTRSSELALDEPTVRFLRATQCEEEAHYNNLLTAGAVPIAGSYTISDDIFANPTTFLTTWTELESIMVGLYLAASRQMALDGEPDLVEMMYQIGTVEAQHLALLRQALGEAIAANRAFAAWQFDSTQSAIDRITTLGYLGGTGTTYDYPGPGDRYCRGVIGLVAETTADQKAPDVTAAPQPDASPEASPVVEF